MSLKVQWAEGEERSRRCSRKRKSSQTLLLSKHLLYRSLLFLPPKPDSKSKHGYASDAHFLPSFHASQWSGSKIMMLLKMHTTLMLRKGKEWTLANSKPPAGSILNLEKHTHYWAPYILLYQHHCHQNRSSHAGYLGWGGKKRSVSKFILVTMWPQALPHHYSTGWGRRGVTSWCTQSLSCPRKRGHWALGRDREAGILQLYLKMHGYNSLFSVKWKQKPNT